MIVVTVHNDNWSGSSSVDDSCHVEDLVRCFVGAAVAAGWSRETVIDYMAALVDLEQDGKEEGA